MTASEPRTTEKAADASLGVAVWDWPIRLVHWSLVLLIAFSWWSAENEKIEWHIASGTAVLFLLLFRLFWGVFGSSTARFASFVTGPKRLAAYLRAPGAWRGIGHTPLGALSVLALLGLMLLQVLLGLPLSDEDGTYSGPLNRLVSFDTAERLQNWHETLFNVLLGFIFLHVAAILFYHWRGKRLVRAMMTGRSRDLPSGTEGLKAAPAWRLVLAVLLAGGMTSWIANGVPGL